MGSDLDDDLINEKEILFFPSGDVSVPQLGLLLVMAHDAKRKDDVRIKCLERERISEYGADVPEYQIKARRESVGELRKLYKELTGDNFNPDMFSDRNKTNHAVIVGIVDTRNGRFNVYDIGS